MIFDDNSSAPLSNTTQPLRHGLQLRWPEIHVSICKCS